MRKREREIDKQRKKQGIVGEGGEREKVRKEEINREPQEGKRKIYIVARETGTKDDRKRETKGGEEKEKKIERRR